MVQNPGSLDIKFEAVRTNGIDNMSGPLINSVEDQCDSPVVVSNTTKLGTPKESVEADVENLAIDENVSSLSQTESRMVLTSVVVQRDLSATQEEVHHSEILDSVVVSASTYVKAGETAGVQTFGRSKRKRAPARQNQLDEVNDSHFNDCLCGSVVIPTSNGALMCKQVGCETQFLSIGVSFSH